MRTIYTFTKLPMSIHHHDIHLIPSLLSDLHIYGKSDAIPAVYKRWLAEGSLSRRDIPRHRYRSAAGSAKPGMRIDIRLNGLRLVDNITHFIPASQSKTLQPLTVLIVTSLPRIP